MASIPKITPKKVVIPANNKLKVPVKPVSTAKVPIGGIKFGVPAATKSNTQMMSYNSANNKVVTTKNNAQQKAGTVAPTIGFQPVIQIPKATIPKKTTVVQSAKSGQGSVAPTQLYKPVINIPKAPVAPVKPIQTGPGTVAPMPSILPPSLAPRGGTKQNIAPIPKVEAPMQTPSGKLGSTKEPVYQTFNEGGMSQDIAPVTQNVSTPASTTPVAGAAGGTTNATFSSAGTPGAGGTSVATGSTTSGNTIQPVGGTATATGTIEPVAPATPYQQRTWDKLSLDQQQSYIDTHPTFDPTAMGLVMKGQADYDMAKIEKFSGLSVDDAINGNYNLNDIKKYNPNLYTQIKAKKSETTDLADVNSSITPEGTSLQDMVTKLFGETTTVDLSQIKEDLMEQYNVTGLQEENNTNKSKVLEVQSLMRNKLTEIRARYEGTGATEGFIRAMAAKENTYLQQELDDATTAYGLSSDNLNDALSNVNDSLKTSMDQYNIDRQSSLDNMSKMGFVQQLMSFETPQQKDDRERQKFLKQQAYTEGDINSSDPATRQRAITNAVDGVLAEFKGIPMVRSRDQMVADIQKLVKGGMDLGTAITQNIRTPIMKKDEYKLWSAKNLGVSDYVTMGGYDISFNEDGTMKVTQGSSSYNGLYEGPKYTPATQQKLQDSFNQIVSQGDGSIGGQCGSFVNDYLQDMGVGRLFTDPIDRKKAVSNTNTASVGSVAIMDSPTQPDYGHVGIVTAINGDGTVTIKQSNRNGDEKVFTSNVKTSDIYGFFDPRIAGANSISNPAQSSPYGKMYDKYNEKATLPPAATLKSMGMTANQFIARAYEYGLNKEEVQPAVAPLSDDQRTIFNSTVSRFEGNQVIKDFEQLYGQLKNSVSSLSDKSGPGDVAAVYQFMKVLDPSSVVRETEFAIAAKSAGVLPYIGNTFKRLENGEILTDKQRGAFAKLMTTYTKNKSESYNRLYGNMSRVLENSGIDRSYRPSNATEGFDLSQEQGQTVNTPSYSFNIQPVTNTNPNSIIINGVQYNR